MTSSSRDTLPTLFLLIAILSSCSSSDLSDDAGISSKCRKVNRHFDECWIKHHLPICKGTIPVTVCAETKYGYGDIMSCPHSAQLYRSVNVQYILYCTKPAFKSEFHNRVPCWISSRKCTNKLAGTNPDDVTLDKVRCGELIDESRNCNDYDLCTELHKNFVDAVAARSGCGIRFPESTPDQLVAEFRLHADATTTTTTTTTMTIVDNNDNSLPTTHDNQPDDDNVTEADEEEDNNHLPSKTARKTMPDINEGCPNSNSADVVLPMSAILSVIIVIMVTRT